ncbi:uncharacterized protein LOC115728516 [Rhodamnia argentea]|uniref:Uncharacterized protein LOC115728516 n=1 Tax=Rhodamnia argentea TaxID=178133 RepID=A0A8B8MX62_9MYRT|nr:uncharacterized protein LOC115728516 [Rhodamnia argentea]
MGNCQAIDAAALVIQHPDGRIERLYWPVMASEVMRNHPGHYVSLIIPLPSPPAFEEDGGNPKEVRFTRVKLLRPGETLALGHAYRLITSQEVMKVLRAKKYAKMKEHQHQPETAGESESEVGVSAPRNTSCQAGGGGGGGGGSSDTEKTNQDGRSRKHRSLKHQNNSPANSALAKSKLWRPTLHSISEAAS